MVGFGVSVVVCFVDFDVFVEVLMVGCVGVIGCFGMFYNFF